MEKKTASRRGQPANTKAESSEEVRTFAKAAKTFGGKATVTKAAARKALINLGISTKTGKLTKRYR